MRPIATAIEDLPLRDYEGSNPVAQIQAAFEAWLARAPHEVVDLRAAQEEVAPDLLLVDANTWGAAAFAESQGRRWAAFLPYALPVASRDTPAFGPGFAPPRHALDRLRDAAVRAVFRRSAGTRVSTCAPTLPHAEVIPQVDLVVTHGGMGTTQRALSASVPVCVVPWGRDQSESARRAEVCGARRGAAILEGWLAPPTTAS